MPGDPNANDQARNPVESIASDVVESLRVGRRSVIDPIVEANPDHESELRELLPVIERLERARKSQAERPNGLASLGSSRPDHLGDFELVRQIGRGGMGVVFEARQRSLGRTVAVKVLPKSLLVDSVQLKRFQQEARTAASLHHTNIVPVFGVGEDQGFHYYVMQCIEGRGLDRIMCDGYPELTPKQVAHLGQQAASALAHAHSQNVLHRDIKPANLIVNDENELWVTDFGVAKAIESEAVTRTGDVVGTLRYMAPEQIVGATDVRSDLYSLGVTLYELLAGRPAMDVASIRSAIVTRKPAPTPPPLRQLNPQVPRDLETILHTAMAPNPDRRYASARAMADDLQRFLEGESISVRRTSFLQKSVRWARRNPAVAALSALSMTLLIGVALISSIGYFRLQRVLDREQIARRDAVNTAGLAAGALDQVFQRFAVPSTDPLSDSSEFATTPALSVEAAELLEGLLHYFDALASRGHFDPRLRESAVNARYSIGDIHFQLGHYQRAIDRFNIALEDTNPNDPNAAIRDARIRNRIGYAYRMLGETDKAIEQHRHALNELTEGDAVANNSTREPAHQFELARTHFMLGSRNLAGMLPSAFPPLMALNLESIRREGPPRNDDRRHPADEPNRPVQRSLISRPNDSQIEHLQAAVGILRKLLESDPESARYSVALASCLRQMVSDSLATRTSSEVELEQEAIEILRRLNQRYPQDASVSLELASALSAFTVFEHMTREDHHQAAKRCREAVKLCDHLVASHPNVPSYNNAQIHALFRLGVLVERMSRRERNGRELEQEASEAFRRAARQQAVVLRQHPNRLGFQAWHAVFLMRYGDLASRTGNLEQAERALTESAHQWVELCDQCPGEDVSWHAAPQVYRFLSHVQHRMGNHSDAKESMAEAEVRVLYRDLE